MQNILVFFGGRSAEHDISVITGVLTTNCLNKAKFNPIPVYVDNDGKWYTGEALIDIEFYKSINYKVLKQVTLIGGSNCLYAIKKNRLKSLGSIKCAINCMHGINGEDGSLAGLLALCNVPLCSPDLSSSGVAIDKVLTKYVLKGLGVKTLPYASYNYGDDLQEIEAKLGYPMIVKPATLGSSIGITVADNIDELEKGVLLASKYDNKILIEKCLKAVTEINVAVYKGKNGLVVSECEMPVTKNNLLTFEDKYAEGDRVFPAPIEKRLAEKFKKIAREVYEKLNFSGVIRIDFLLKDNQIYLNEINSVPGSLSYYLFCDTLADFTKMLDEIIEQSLTEFNKKQSTIKTFESNILSIEGSKGGKRL